MSADNELSIEAEARGVEVAVSDDYHLQLDWDENVIDMQRYEEVMAILKERGIIAEPLNMLETVSQHGNRHRYIALAVPLTWIERSALQAMLQSDPKREVLSFLRALQDTRDTPTALFETPGLQATRAHDWKSCNAIGRGPGYLRSCQMQDWLKNPHRLSDLLRDCAEMSADAV